MSCNVERHRVKSQFILWLQIPVRPFRHNEYERFITAAFPYYGASFTMVFSIKKKLEFYYFVNLYHLCMCKRVLSIWSCWLQMAGFFVFSFVYLYHKWKPCYNRDDCFAIKMLFLTRGEYFEGLVAASLAIFII